MPQKRTKRVRTSASPSKHLGRASSRVGTPSNQGRAKASRARHGRATATPRATSFSSSLSTPTLRGDVAEGYEVKLPNGNEVLLTRRHFLYGAAGLAALAVVGTGGYVVDQITGNSSSAAPTLTVNEDEVFTTDDCTLIENSNNAMQLVTVKELPYGTLVFASDDTWAACLIPTEEAKPLTQIGMLSLTSGTCNVLVKKAVGQDEGFEIYDARACYGGLVWAEADIMDGLWRIYSATTDGGSIGEPVLLEEGDANWEMPTIAASVGYAWWQLLPRLDGEFSTENSKLKRAPFGSANAEEVYLSKGRMCTPVYASAEGVVITPRAQTSGTYYQLTYINASGQPVDALVLPSSMRPIEAGYGPKGFNFAFDAIYNYGGGIANLGTYTSATASAVTANVGASAAASAEAIAGEDESASSADTSSGNESAKPASIEELVEKGAGKYSHGTWFRFPRTPTAGPAWCGKWLIVKSTTAVCGVDLENRQYFTLEVKSGSDDYGDYLATTGNRSRIVTYSNIDHVPLEGDPQKCCLVRVWAAV